ncbi:MAG: aldehyde dehydrogenase family protein, partial [Pyrinomonadaceae bacterium]|nr:aldehyde dehydrogenase family protein [Phycisphaerales bacterium]
MSTATQTDRKTSNPLDALPEHRDLFYGGAWHAPKAATYVDTINPADAAPIAGIASAGAEDVELATQAAHTAFLQWRRLKPLERAGMLRQAGSVLRAHAEELAMLDALNTGNPVAEMVRDATIAAAGIDYFAGLVTEVKGETIPMGDGHLNYTLREPLGVVARIVAYNHPLMFTAMKIGAPLATGNTIIVKPPEQAPLSALRMAELIGGIFPPGVLNVLPGAKECGQALTVHPKIKKVTLIGSVPTGKAIMKSASDSLKPVLLELGGKNALIAFPDADIQALIAGAVQGM